MNGLIKTGLTLAFAAGAACIVIGTATLDRQAGQGIDTTGAFAFAVGVAFTCSPVAYLLGRKYGSREEARRQPW